MYKISVPDEDISFDCDEGETVLDAVERAGYAIPYSCRKGVCSSCEGVIKTGTAMVRGQGLCTGPVDGVLLCQARPKSDLEILPTRIRPAEIVERKLFETKVRKITRPAPDVAVLQIRFPIGNRAVFKAGQYLRVIMPDGDSRNYSMANPPHQNDGVELHIRHVLGGKFSESILAKLEKGSVLTLELPYGEFGLSEDDETLAIMIATGTGFAPIKSMVEDQIRRGGTQPTHLYWGARTLENIYLAELAEKWAANHDWFKFTPVVSQPDDKWAGRKGFVHKAVQTDYPNMSRLKVYACGAPAMIAAAKKDFCTESKLAEEAFFSDAFVPSGDLDAEIDPGGNDAES